MKLYEVDGAIQQILDRCAVDPDTGEAPEEWGGFRPDMEAALDALEYKREQLALHLGAKVKEYEALADAIASEAKRLKRRSDVLAARADRLRAYIAANIPEGMKYEDERVRIGWRRSERVLIRDSEALPERLWRVTRAPALDLIRRELKEKEVPGAEMEKRMNLVVT